MNYPQRFQIFSRLVALALSLSACGTVEAPAREDFAVELNVQSDDGNPVRGAELARGTAVLGASGDDGALRLRMSGREGQVVPLALTCPAGFAEARGALSLRLTRTRRVGATVAGPQKLDAVCARGTRDVVLAVHAPGGDALPIKVNGEAAGTTDPGGNAHVLLRVARELKALDVELDTDPRRALDPPHPRKIFALEGRDAILLVEQTFVPRRTVAAPSRRSGARRHVPTRID